jgi:hypothetical protein
MILVFIRKITYDLHISPKLENDVRLVPIRATCGGFNVNLIFSPSFTLGFFSRMILNTRDSN